ncbi:L-2-hydroxyglutarate oxidase [Sanguibacter gelidistatuariae]|uniref:L-2-hydroxyglutarate oxidase n=1 Tax=Sanguibacter gelidistatuariae TaxID=1814289 RepID=A0A1G6QD41_9MICO|nr:L-2-hydroxyglutarate oxidase [Sanguibacter gelidistatuariae]SDC90223.1 L-2-hydroxyglutarate oxidase [Sanguibacter gelidistatuariae]
MRVLIVGAGIIGLATAARLAQRGDDVLVVEKEPDLAQHQTGRNSGVVHSGLYYAPGSLKARLGAAGARSMPAFAREHGVAVETCGKLVVAVDATELPRLQVLAERGMANGVDARMIGPDEARDYEPDVSCVAALRVESTGIIDYRGVCLALADQVRDAGGEIRFGLAFRGARTEAAQVRAWLDDAASPGREEVVTDAMVVCGGLQADRLAVACGLEPGARIVPFRGEYFELAPSAASRVKGLIYPVPDPRFPFLGVHLTKMVHGGVHAGPNAVLALAREGYRRRDVSPADVADALSWPGLWRLGARNWAPGAREVARSMSAALFAKSLARLVPGIGPDDLVPAPAGVRAQALKRDGSMVDDFLLRTRPRQVHVINAPSPAATASLEIAKHIVSVLDESTA